MTNDEAKTAAWDECPVRYRGMFYKRITALIYRKNPDGGWFMSVELEDGCSVRSVTIADVRDVERI